MSGFILRAAAASSGVASAVGAARRWDETFEGYLRRRLAERLEAARVLRLVGRRAWGEARYQLECARDLRVFLAKFGGLPA